MFYKRFHTKLNIIYEMGFFNCNNNNSCTKVQPIVGDYVKSEFVNNVGIGILIFIFTLFLTIVVGKALGKAMTWTGVGSIDKTFGLMFGVFKGYVVSVCIFSILNWFILTRIGVYQLRMRLVLI